MLQIAGRWSSPRSLVFAFAIALGLVLIFAACSGDEATPTPGTVEPATPTPAATPISIPDETATPETTVTPPTAIPIQTDDDDETEALIPSDLKTYTDDLYGYTVQVPDSWTGERAGTRLLGVATTFDTDSDDLFAQTIVLFSAEKAHAADIAREQVTPLAGLSGFRTITESDIILDDGLEAHQVFYGYGTGSNEHRGAVTFVTRGTMAMGIQTQAPRTIYERNFDVLEAVSTSIRPVDPEPFGSPPDDTLVLYLDDGPLTMDPGISTDSGSSQYIRQIFSGLVRLNANLIPEPDLATWEVSEDGTVYTFTINEGAQFHDGSPVTAQDFVFSWERALNRNLPPVGGSAGSYLDDIVGAKEYHAGEADSIAGLEAVDDSTLVVTIDEAKSYFVSKLTHPAAFVVLQSNVPEVPDPRLVEEEDVEGQEEDTAGSEEAEEEDVPDPWYYTAIGTGPYRIAHYESARAAHLTAFAEYLGPSHSIGNLVFRFHAGLPTAMIEEGFVDATTAFGLGFYDFLVQEENPLVDQISQTDSLLIHYLAFNTTVEPFDDPDVRRAFLWAVDRQAIFEEHGAPGLNIAHGFMPPGLPGYDENIAEVTYDPVAAKELLDSTAFGQLDEEERIITIVGGGDLSTIDRAIFTQWQDNLGVRVLYQPFGPTYLYRLPQVVEIGFNMYRHGWIADYPDPHNFLDVLFHTESPNNDGKSGSAGIDDLLEQARTAGEDRLEQYREIERRMIQEAVAFPLYFGSDFILASERVSGLSLDAQGFLRLEEAELDPE
ncbi:MAG: peptide ABC transporter substrate-binding protein [Chloroflexi bacterium]|nr:peptide ABC transporter substrate-binding protein [Chloroflexota bacterium]